MSEKKGFPGASQLWDWVGSLHTAWGPSGGLCRLPWSPPKTDNELPEKGLTLVFN